MTSWQLSNETLRVKRPKSDQQKLLTLSEAIDYIPKIDQPV